MFIDFNTVFHPEKKWMYKSLIKSSPCNDCATYKEYEHKAIFGTIAERQYAELPDSCDRCLKRLLWLNDCLEKLAWYERHDDYLTDDTKPPSFVNDVGDI